MPKVSKFSKQVLAKQQQIEKIVKSIIPDAGTVTVSTECHSSEYQRISVHVFMGNSIICSFYDWDDTIGNLQRIRDSYNEYLASQ